MIRVIFFGTSNFAIPALDRLHALEGVSVSLVVTKPDEPQGRKGTETPTPIKVRARELGLTVLSPERLKDIIPDLQEIKPDVGVVAAYGKILPQIVLNIPTHGFLNIHPSLLPRHRGPSPVQATIAQGDPEAGVTIIKIDAQMDHGPIAGQELVALQGNEWYEDLKKLLAERGADLLAKILFEFVAGEINLIDQDHTRATVCKELTRDNGRVDFRDEPPISIWRKLRAYSPWPGIWTEVTYGKKTLRVKILDARLEHGSLKILRVQPEGGKSMTGEAFRNGYPGAADSLSA